MARIKCLFSGVQLFTYEDAVYTSRIPRTHASWPGGPDLDRHFARIEIQKDGTSDAEGFRQTPNGNLLYLDLGQGDTSKVDLLPSPNSPYQPIPPNALNSLINLRRYIPNTTLEDHSVDISARVKIDRGRLTPRFTSTPGSWIVDPFQSKGDGPSEVPFEVMWNVTDVEGIRVRTGDDVASVKFTEDAMLFIRIGNADSGIPGIWGRLRRCGTTAGCSDPDFPWLFRMLRHKAGQPHRPGGYPLPAPTYFPHPDELPEQVGIGQDPADPVGIVSPTCLPARW